MTAPAEGGRGGTPPRPPAPAAAPGQRFVLGGWIFDVTAAAALLAAAPRPARPVPAVPWAVAYGLVPVPSVGPPSIPLIGAGPGFDPEYAMGTDLDQPVIIASVTADGTGEPSPLLIDGSHRVYKAARTGVEHVPGYLLTVAETLDIRRDAFLGPGRPPARRPGNRKENP